MFIGGSGGGGRGTRAPNQFSFIFMQFLGKYSQIIGWRPTFWKSTIRHCCQYLDHNIYETIDVNKLGKNI